MPASTRPRRLSLGAGARTGREQGARELVRKADHTVVDEVGTDHPLGEPSLERLLDDWAVGEIATTPGQERVERDSLGGRSASRMLNLQM
jgi:hypothetical protein